MNPLLHEVASSMFYPPRPGDEPGLKELLERRLIRPAQQGKLHGYALTPAGYRLWLGHGQGERRGR